MRKCLRAYAESIRAIWPRPWLCANRMIVCGEQMPGWDFAHAWDESESECSIIPFRLGGMASQYFKTYHIHIPGLWKNGPIHILDHPKCWHIHILLFDFCTHLLWLLDKYHSQFIEYQGNKQPRTISERKICAHTRMSEKWGLSHRNPEKSGHSYTFLLKKGCQSFTWQRWKGDHLARTSILCHI